MFKGSVESMINLVLTSTVSGLHFTSQKQNSSISINLHEAQELSVLEPHGHGDVSKGVFALNRSRSGVSCNYTRHTLLMITQLSLSDEKGYWFSIVSYI